MRVLGNSHGAKSSHDDRDAALAAAIEPLAEQLDPVPPSVVDAAKAVFTARASDETADPGTLTPEGAGR
jgi:hypothetical protein